jgi:hypothetical protein
VAAGFLKGAALVAHNDYALSHFQAGTTLTWTDFTTNLEKAFPRYNQQQEARKDFYALVQDNLTVEAYTNKFNQLQGRLNPRPTPADLLYRFSTGLTYDIAIDPSTGRLWEGDWMDKAAYCIATAQSRSSRKPPGTNKYSARLRTVQVVGKGGRGGRGRGGGTALGRGGRGGRGAAFGAGRGGDRGASTSTGHTGKRTKVDQDSPCPIHGPGHTMRECTLLKNIFKGDPQP